MSNSSLKVLFQQRLNSEFTILYNEWKSSSPNAAAENPARIADAWFVTAHIADALSELDAAYLLRQDKPLSALMEQWQQGSHVKAIQKELIKCVSDVSAAELEASGNMTVKELLSKNPDTGISIFSPCGYIDLSAEKARELLSGSPVSANPGDIEFAMKTEADEILGQVVLSGQLENGVWYVTADWPEPEIEQGGPQMGGLS